MKRKFYLIWLNFSYYFSCVQIKLMELRFTIIYILKNKKMPRKLTEEQLDELRIVLKEAFKKDKT